MLKRHFGEFPYQAPSGYKWVPNGWKLVEVDATEKLWIKSFEVFLDKIKEPLGKNTGEVKQHRLNCHSKLVSQKEFLEQLQIKEEESKTSKNKSCKKPNKKGLLTTAEKENSSESEIEDESVKSSEEEDEDSDESIEERKKHEIPCINIKQPELYLFSVWDSLSPPVSEENLIGKWYAIIFGEKIPYLFIAKFDWCFLQDENGPLAAIIRLLLFERKDTTTCWRKIKEINTLLSPVT